MQGKQVTVNKEKLDTLRGMLEKAKGSFAAVLPKHITPERIIKIALSATSRNPKLLLCDSKSIILAVMQAAQLGLEPNDGRGLCYIIPYQNNKRGGIHEAQFQIGYKGLTELVTRAGKVLDVTPYAVYKQDDFKCVFGINPIFEHKPNWELEHRPEDITHFYAIATLENGFKKVEVMSKSEIDSIRNRFSKAKSADSPWNSDYQQMGRKTVMKRICNYLPMSIELAQALNLDNASETGQSQAEYIDVDFDMPGEVIDGNTGEVKPTDQSKSEQLLGQLQEREAA